MIETREKSIDGSNYLVTQLPARRALKMKARLIKLFGPLLMSLDSGSFQNLCQTIDENQFESLCMEMIQGVRKNGVELTPATFDLEFAGDMAGIYKVLLFIIEVNYSNFFTMIGIGIPSFSDDPTPIVQSTKRTFTGK